MDKAQNTSIRQQCKVINSPWTAPLQTPAHACPTYTVVALGVIQEILYGVESAVSSLPNWMRTADLAARVKSIKVTQGVIPESVEAIEILHYIPLHLDEGWRGMHVLFVVYLLRAGVRKLQDYLASATRPAAILLLLQRLNDADVIRRHGDRMRHLISAAQPGNESRLGQMTPLGMLQEMTAGLMR
ncbi:hypothetical protein LTR02_017651 [Friedmanniomyces endolithicus]|nr:hypothetical protein LTR02_017651 [Friedmanniomyces endolithicus]